jgi:hypothetical protein
MGILISVYMQKMEDELNQKQCQLSKSIHWNH